MAINIIEYNGQQYADKKIEAATGYQSATVVGDELPFDTLEADVWDYSTALLQYCTNDEIKLYQTQDGLWLYNQLAEKSIAETFVYAAPVLWTHKGNLIISQFLKNVARIGKNKFRLSCVSGVGLIAESRHYGGLYSGTLFSAILADVIGGAFPYVIDSDIGSIPVYGWLPVATRRENLQKMLTSSGAVIRTNEDGLPWFTAPVTDVSKSISDSAIYLGGSVEYPTPYKAVKVTEHAYAQTPADLLMTLFDGAANAESIVTPKGITVVGVLVTFSDPMHDLEITGGSILESDVNYAVLGPSTACQLTGYKYSHTKRVVTAGQQDADEQATKRIEDCTLINLFNSEAVAQRWLGYYGAQKKITMSAVWNGEQPADTVQFSDPYDEPALGIIETLDVRMSNKIAADAVVQAGTIPPIVGNFFQNVLVVTQSWPVTIPAECKGKIRAVLISGGTGGSSGLPGSDSTQVYEEVNDTVNDASRKTRYANPSVPSPGGQAGEPGAGGKIFVVTMEATPGQQIQAVIGVGGAGGVYSATESHPGSPGTDTTFGGYSSADGEASEFGYVDAINGVAYAVTGSAGTPGGAGGGIDENGDPVDPQSVEYNGTTYSGGTNATSQTLEDSSGRFDTAPYGYVEAYAEGGFGGGAAAGANGNNGAGPAEASESTGYAESTAGQGGAGANAIAPAAPSILGAGGTGGNGGGGAGSSGLSYTRNTWANPATGGASLVTLFAPTVSGGAGSDGSPGANGVLLIYY